jgi:hypothetical protein
MRPGEEQQLLIFVQIHLKGGLSDLSLGRTDTQERQIGVRIHLDDRRLAALYVCLDLKLVFGCKS